MRVLMIDPLNYTAPYNKALCSSLSQLGSEVLFLGSSSGHESWRSLNVEYIPFKFEILPNGNEEHSYEKWLRRLKTVARLLAAVYVIRRLKPDVIHFQWLPSEAYTYFARYLRKVAPVILTVHDTVPYNDKVALSRLHRRWTKTLNHLDQLIVHTNEGRSHLESLGIKVPIATIRHGTLQPRDLPSSEHPIIKATNKTKFLLFGLIKPYKGVDVLLRSIKLMPPSIRQQCCFVVAGRAAMDTRPLKFLASQLQIDDSVEFIERHFSDAEVGALLREADVLVFPYKQIDVSGVLMLSLPIGRAIIASNIGGFSELLEDGRSALLVPPEAPEHLADALTRLATDGSMRDMLARNARNLCSSDWREIAELTRGIYSTTLTGRMIA